MLKEGNGTCSELYYILSIAGLRYGRIWRADCGVASKSTSSGASPESTTLCHKIPT